MELRESLSGKWRALILVPAITAVIAGLLFASSADEEFQATAVVRITEFVETGSAAGLRAAIDDLDSALGSRRVLEVVSQIAPEAESARIQLNAVGESGDVRVSFGANSAEEAEVALEAGVREALTIVSETQRRITGRELVAANEQASESAALLQDFEAAAGAADLENELARRSADILALRNQIAANADDFTVQSALRETLETKEQELEAISAQLLPWTNSRARFELAVAAGADASLELRNIEVNEEDLQTQEILQSLRVPEQSVLPDLIRVVVAAAVVTGGAVVLLALAVGSDQRRRRDVTARSRVDRDPRVRGRGSLLALGDERSERWAENGDDGRDAGYDERYVDERDASGAWREDDRRDSWYDHGQDDDRRDGDDEYDDDEYDRDDEYDSDDEYDGEYDGDDEYDADEYEDERVTGTSDR